MRKHSKQFAWVLRTEVAMTAAKTWTCGGASGASGWYGLFGHFGRQHVPGLPVLVSVLPLYSRPAGRHCPMSSKRAFMCDSLHLLQAQRTSRACFAGAQPALLECVWRHSGAAVHQLAGELALHIFAMSCPEEVYFKPCCIHGLPGGA